MNVRVKFEPRDVWVGVFWDRRDDGFHLYMCPIPLVVIHWHRSRLSFTEQEADRNASLGREESHCPVCADLPHSPHGMRARPLPMRGNREAATYELSDDARPCCLTTGSHHHPACTTNRTGTEQQ